MTHVVVVGGGIAGLSAARRLEALLPGAQITLVERSERLGGKLLTERDDGFVIEGAADSFLSRKPRGVALAEELGLGRELVGRRPENARTFVRSGGELHPLPEGLTGMIPTNLAALEDSRLLSPDGRKRIAAEIDVPAAPPGGDESIAAFVSRRFGREAYEKLVEPLMTGIFGGDGERLSLQATFPRLRALELEHGSVLRGLEAGSAAASRYPPFVSMRDGMGALAGRLADTLERTRISLGRAAKLVRRASSGYDVELEGGVLEADGLVLAAPAYAVAELLAELDPELAGEHTAIPYASSAIVTFAFAGELRLDGYGYVVPRTEGSEVLACTWSSSKWHGRAPDRVSLVRVYLGRFGRAEVTALSDEDLVERAAAELDLVGIDSEHVRAWIHRWPLGMPQYVLGHPARLERIEAAAARHPGLALAGAAYRGAGIPDCIESGERAAGVVARSLVQVPR